MDRVNQLLEMSSVRLRRSSLGDEKSPHQDLTKDTRARSLSFDSSYFRALAQGGGAFTSLKEESSDESTIISSQTSTLTRNQGQMGFQLNVAIVQQFASSHNLCSWYDINA